MMMRMLEAGGIPILTDSVRRADPDNPKGYFEFEPVKETRRNPDWLNRADGHAVKMVHTLLRDLPEGRRYAVVMMHRDLDEVLASQQKMLNRSGRTGAAIPPEALKRVFAAQLQDMKTWMAERAWFRRLDVEYANVVRNPLAESERVAAFLGVATAGAMALAVDPALYRNRRQQPGGSS